MLLLLFRFMSAYYDAMHLESPVVSPTVFIRDRFIYDIFFSHPYNVFFISGGVQTEHGFKHIMKISLKFPRYEFYQNWFSVIHKPSSSPTVRFCELKSPEFKIFEKC